MPLSPTFASSRAARCSSTTSPFRSKGGFTLLELSIVVLIVGILAALSVPALIKSRVNARSSVVMNDFRVFSAAFQAYAQEHGDWPPGGNPPGVFPAGMDGYLNQTNWSRVTPIGGLYQFATNSIQGGNHYAAVIVISSVPGNPVTTDAVQLSDIDRKLDDNNLLTGNFFLGFRNYPVYVLEH